MYARILGQCVHFDHRKEVHSCVGQERVRYLDLITMEICHSHKQFQIYFREWLIIKATENKGADNNNPMMMKSIHRQRKVVLVEVPLSNHIDLHILCKVNLNITRHRSILSMLWYIDLYYNSRCTYKISRNVGAIVDHFAVIEDYFFIELKLRTFW